MKKYLENINAQKVLEQIENFVFDSNKDSLSNEISLSQVWTQSENAEIAIITAFCIDNDGHNLSLAENKEKNKELLAVLLIKGYLISKEIHSYTEHFQHAQMIEKPVESFFVVNRNNDKDFFEIIIKLGKYYNQNSVLLKPVGENAFLYGTNNNFSLGLDKKIDLGQIKGIEEAELNSEPKNRSSYFSQTYEHYGIGGKQVITKISKIVLKDISK
jgi:hypothetical protein